MHRKAYKSEETDVLSREDLHMVILKVIFLFFIALS